jgi:hypothetical protein
VYVIGRQGPIRKLALTSSGQNSKVMAIAGFLAPEIAGRAWVVFSPPEKYAHSGTANRCNGLISQNAMNMVRQAIPTGFAAILRI